MEHILDKIGLTYFWGKIKATFAKKSELEAHPTARIYMGSCSTAAATNPKVCAVEDFPLDTEGKPLVGTLISVKFSATNTSKSTTPELNVNDTGAIRIWYNNAVLATAKSAYAGYANRYINYMYDGTYWVFLGHSTDNNTTYSALTQAKIDAGTETTGRLISADLLRDNFYTESEVDGLLGSKANSNDLATVATSGSYNDLDDTPTIPAAPGTLNTNNTTAQTVSSSESLSGTIKLHKVAKTGNAYDLNNMYQYLPETTTVPNVTSVGSASTWSFAMGTGNDEHTLIISGGNGTAPSLGTAKTVATGRHFYDNNSPEPVYIYSSGFTPNIGGSN